MSEPWRKITRVTRSKDEARIFYNKISRRYDFWSEGFEGACRREALEQFDVRPGETLLEVGYGTGHGLKALATAVGGTGQIFGIDISDGMAGIAYERVRRAEFQDRVRIDQGDAACLPYDEAFFDGIFMSFTLELFDTPEIPLILDECLRVLKTRGRLAAAALSKEAPSIAGRLYEGVHRLMPRSVDCRPIYLRRTLEASGFTVLSVSLHKKWGLPVEIVLASPAI